MHQSEDEESKTSSGLILKELESQIRHDRVRINSLLLSVNSALKAPNQPLDEFKPVSASVTVLTSTLKAQ